MRYIFIILMLLASVCYATTDEAKQYFAQGMQMQQQRNNVEAVKYFKKSVQLFQNSVGNRNELTQGAKIFLARAYSSIGDMRGAIETIADVLKNEINIHGENSPEFASSLNDLGNFYGSIKEYREAKKVFERAYEIDKNKLGNNAPDTITCLESLIRVSSDLNELENLISYLKEEISVSEKNLPLMTIPFIKSSCQLADILKNRLCDFMQASEFLNNVYLKKDLYNRLSDQDKASLLHSLAEGYEFSGKYGEALPLYIKSVELYRKTLGNENNLTIVAINDLGSMYQAMGQPEMALPLSKEVYEVRNKYRAQNNKGFFVGALNYAASLQAAGENDKALIIYKKLFDTAKSAKNGSFEYQCLGDIYSNMGGIEKEFTKKIVFFNKALEIFKQTKSPNNPIISESLLGIANLYLEEGQYNEALKCAVEADNIIDKNGGYNQRNFKGLVTLYYLYKQNGNDQKAKDYGWQYIKISSKYLPVMLNLGETQRLSYAKELSFGVPADLMNENDISTLILRWKSTVIDSLLEDRTLLKKAGNLNRNQINTIQNIKNQIAGLLVKTDLDSDNKVFLLQQKIDEIQSEMAKQSRFQIPVRNSLKYNSSDLLSVLQTNEVIIDFINYKIKNNENCYGLSLLFKGGNPIFIKLKNSDINDAIELYRKAIATGDEASLNAQIQILSEKLWKPITAALPPDTKKIYIGADGHLNFLSFATLFDDQGKFLSEKYQIAYIGSGRDLLRPAKPVDKKSMVIYANPVFASDNASTPKSSEAKVSSTNQIMRPAELAEFAKVQLPQLPGTEQEAAIVSQIAKDSQWSAETHLGANASKKGLMAMKAPAVLHLATHGFFLGGEESGGDGERGMKVVATPDVSAPSSAPTAKPLKISPMRQSGVALTGGQSTLQAWGRGEFPDPSNDGILTAEEVAGLNLDGTWLVTLSACETGVGQVQSGEGVFGLRRAFMMAGAQNLLMTLWPVSDEVTPKIMADFYKKALATGDAAGSLSDVQRDWLVKLRDEKGLLAAVRDAGPFAMVVMANPNVKATADTNVTAPAPKNDDSPTAISAGASADALDDCVQKTKAIMDQKIHQNAPSIQELCTEKFKKLLKAGLYAAPGDQCALDADFRYDTQDDYPKVNSTGPAAQNGVKVSVPVELQFGTNAPFTKTWVFAQENGTWLLDDVLTQKSGEPSAKSMADDLSKLPSPPESGSPTVQSSPVTSPAGSGSGSPSILEFSDALAKADAGDAYAQGVVSIYYTVGYMVAKDASKGLTYALKSASQKNPLGLYQVGALREMGVGMKKDKSQARKLMSEAFDGLNSMSADPYALYDLGYMALSGMGVEQNIKEAVRLFKQSADMGYAPSQRMFAIFLEKGVGVPQNHQAAEKYMQEAQLHWSFKE